MRKVKNIGRIIIFFNVFLVIVLFYCGCGKLQDLYIEHSLKKMQGDDLMKESGTIRVILCGTGSPQVNAKSNQPCTVIAAGGRAFLFDAGENAWRSIEACNIPISSISTIFITHWHSDHFSGLGGVINNSWINGRMEPLIVHGPDGVGEVVRGLKTAYRLDAGYRNSHFVPHPELAFAEARTVTIPEGAESAVVYHQEGVRIEAFRVDHRPVEPAFGYLLAYRNRKIFISGDTRVTNIYFDAINDADIAVHEGVNGAMIRRAAACMRGLGMTDRAEHTERILEYHADTIELAKLAERAGVKHLMLTHLIPEPTNYIARYLFKKGMSDYFHGELTIGYDSMAVKLNTR